MKTLAIVAVSLVCLSSSPLAAQQAPPLGQYHGYLAFGAMVMQHVTFANDDAGPHVGAAVYRHLGQSWYLGAELGRGESFSLFGDDSGITLCEVNAKRVFAPSGLLRLDLGGGLSYNRVTYDEYVLFGPDDGEQISDWVPGVQALTNVHLKLGRFLLGAHLKYMLTGDVAGVPADPDTDKGWDYTNLTFGVQFGFLIP
ncbi:MAG: hypothetical protein R6X35_15050 [Candidatus Krumholzibacteriia bacterium]